MYDSKGRQKKKKKKKKKQMTINLILFPRHTVFSNFISILNSS